MGKLDAVPVTVNGPEDDLPDWDAVVWRQVGEDVRRLRQRIFTASQAGDLKKVRSLQRLMLRSRANALLSGSPGRSSGCSSRRPTGNCAGSVFR